MPVLSHAGTTVFRFKMLIQVETVEGVFLRRSPEDDVTAPAAVASVRPAAGNVLLPAETDAASSPVTGFNLNLGLIDEFHGRVISKTVIIGRSPPGSSPGLILINADSFFILAEILESHLAVNQSEQGIVATQSHIVTGMESGAQLAHQYIARSDFLAGVTLYAASFSRGVPTILELPPAFLCAMTAFSLCLDLFYPEGGVILAVPLVRR